MDQSYNHAAGYGDTGGSHVPPGWGGGFPQPGLGSPSPGLPYFGEEGEAPSGISPTPLPLPIVSRWPCGSAAAAGAGGRFPMASPTPTQLGMGELGGVPNPGGLPQPGPAWICSTPGSQGEYPPPPHSALPLCGWVVWLFCCHRWEGRSISLGQVSVSAARCAGIGATLYLGGWPSLGRPYSTPSLPLCCQVAQLCWDCTWEEVEVLLSSLRQSSLEPGDAP